MGAMKNPAALLAVAILALLGLMILKGVPTEPPPVRSANMAAQFDTPRAMARLARILGDQRPHPVDSATHDAVRDRLIAEMRAIGLVPEVRDQRACNSFSRNRTINCARTRNIVATIGPDTGKHLLIAAHYDSTPVGPGAADDGIGIASMLETAAHLVRAPLRRPVTFLVTDGEEAGLLGARAFLSDPLAGRIGALINMEARGVNGPAIMYETRDPNGAAIDWYRRAADRPMANSLTADFAKLIPNSTDVEMWKGQPWTILNFAIIGNETRYHTPDDRLENLDPRSLQHMGDQALAAARLAAGNPVPSPESALAYADLWGRAMLAMPLWLSLALLVALALTAVVMAWRTRQQFARGAGVSFVAIFASAAVVYLIGGGTAWFRAGDYMRAQPDVSALAAYATALAVSFLLVSHLGRRISQSALRIGYWVLFLVVGCIAAWFAPGASIFFLAPPAIYLIGRVAGRERTGAILAWLVLFLSWGPLLALIEILLSLRSPATFAMLGAIVLLPALIELRQLQAPKWIAMVPAIAVWAAVLLVPAYSDSRKQLLGIEYAIDANRNSARWLINSDGAPLSGAFAAASKGQAVPFSAKKRAALPAPVIAGLRPPGLTLLSRRNTPEGRLLRVRIANSGHDAMLLRTAPDVPLILASMDGAPPRRFGKGQGKEPFVLRCLGRACDGATLTLLVAGNAPVQFTLVGIRYGLPQKAAPLRAARPAYAQPQYAPDASYIWRTIRM